MTRHAIFQGGVWLGVVGFLALGTSPAEAGGLFRRRSRTVVPTVRTAAPAPSPAPLGTFYPTPYMTVRGNFPTGGGYSPNNEFGDTSMDIYGPMSSLRSVAAPVRTYVRGYDGRTQILEGTSFSTPNLPENSPVVYPTHGTYYYAPRSPITTDPPWWDKGINWIDQN